jgi:hypothetical protein
MASLGDHGLAPLADHQLASLADPALAPLGDHEMASLDRSRIGSNEAITDKRLIFCNKFADLGVLSLETAPAGPVLLQPKPPRQAPLVGQ